MTALDSYVNTRSYQRIAEGGAWARSAQLVHIAKCFLLQDPSSC